MRRLFLIGGLLFITLSGLTGSRATENYSGSLLTVDRGRVSLPVDVLSTNSYSLTVRSQVTGEVVQIYGRPQTDVRSSGDITIEATGDGLKLVDYKAHAQVTTALGRVTDVVGPINGKLFLKLDTSDELYGTESLESSTTGAIGKVAYGYDRQVIRLDSDSQSE